MKTFTINENDKTIELAVLQPTEKQLQEAEAKRISTISRLIKSKDDSLLSRIELEQYLRKNGIWSDEDETTIQQINEDIDKLLIEVKKGGSVSKGRELCITIGEKRLEMLRIIIKRQSYDNATIESQAEMKRDEYLAYVCTVKTEDSEPYWDCFEDFLDECGSETYNNAVKRVMDYLAGEDDVFEKRLPENRWMIKYGYMNDKLEYTDRKSGERVNRYGEPFDETLEIVKQINNLQGEIHEDAPFIDDETGEPIVFDEQKEEVVAEETS